MSGPGEYDNIFELVNPIKPYIRGVCALIHDADEFDKGAEYLLKVNNELGGGNVIFGPYVGDHSHSRNRILKETGIKQNDPLVSLDLMERVPVEFAQQFDQLFAQMEEKEINVANFYSKPYLIRYREDMTYIGTPHESLVCFNLFGTELKRIELNQYFTDENKVRINLRPSKRDKMHFCKHYAAYMLQPNSNQNMLGAEHRGGAQSLPFYEELRGQLIDMLKDKNLSRTTEGLLELLKGPITGNLLIIINNLGWVNYFHRHFVLGETDIRDDHNWPNSLKQF